MRLVFQLPASITSVVDAPRLVSSDASPTRPECAVTGLSTPAACAAAVNRNPIICADSGTTWLPGSGLVAARSVRRARATPSFTNRTSFTSPSWWRQDYFRQGNLGWLRLHEKGGKRHDVPAHHRAAEALDDYLELAGLDEAKAPLFQSVDPAGRRLTGRALARRLVLAMIKRRAAAAELPVSTCCHTFRATGITAYLSNGGTLEHAQRIAGHASPKTTKLYDRTADTITVDEIERIVI